MPDLRLIEAPPDPITDEPCTPVSVAERRADALRASARGMRRALACADLPDDDQVTTYLCRLATRLSLAAELHHPSRRSASRGRPARP